MGLLIVPNDKGWQPTRKKVNSALAEMKLKGLRTDWKYCLALETRGFLFADNGDSDTGEVALIAYKGQFLTEDEYYEADRMPAREIGPQPNRRAR